MDVYPAPVNQLLTFGETKWNDWSIEYVRRLSLSAEHVDALIAMATDWSLHWAQPDDPKIYAPIHAWRALGQLKAAKAVEPLLYILTRLDEKNDDWSHEELPHVFGKIGPPAIVSLAAFLHDTKNGIYTRACAANGLVKIAQGHPETRGECVAALNEVLVRAEDNDPSLNGFIVADLLDLKALESEALIEQAFSDGYVDDTIAGDWIEVRADLHGEPPPQRPLAGRMNPRVLGLSPGLFGLLETSESSPLHYRDEARRLRRKARDKRRKAVKARKRH